MLLLGLDIGTSSVKATVLDAATKKIIASVFYPETEAEIISPQPGWAEQSPEQWWQFTQLAIAKLHATELYNPIDIAALGIAYQMHGLVLVNKQQEVLRNSIIWCDSRAVSIGEDAFNRIGKEKCLTTLLNGPGNFTASKLAWVKQNEPDLFRQIHQLMLPGDFISMKLTGEINTTITGMSEGVFWNFQTNELATSVLDYFGFDSTIIPPVKSSFDNHGVLSKHAAELLSLRQGIPVSYKAGDQPNNALSLGVLKPGEVAATAGTSGVIYAVTNELVFDNASRVNSFAHVNHSVDNTSVGVLMCINGAGILNNQIRTLFGEQHSYAKMNEQAALIPVGSEGLTLLPFCNGAERILNNKTTGAHIAYMEAHTHKPAHFFRAAQEGIAFAFQYGLQMLQSMGMQPSVIRAGRANMFLSEVFTEVFVNTTGIPVELYKNDGSAGAAIGAGIGAGVFTAGEAFETLKPLQTILPNTGKQQQYKNAFERWLHLLNQQLNTKL
jgi:xylulokinase